MITWSLVLSLAATAQTPLSLDDAERIALAHSTEVRLAQDALKSAWAKAGQIAGKTRPQIGVVGSAARFDDKTQVSLDGLTVETLPIHTEDAAVQLSQVLDISNDLGTAHAEARLAALADACFVRARISDQILSTKTAYFNVLRAVEGVKVAQASLTAYRQQLGITTDLWKQGVGLKIDVLRATSQVASAEQNLTQRQDDLNMARSVLNDQLGLPLAAETPLKDIHQPDSAVDALSSADPATLFAIAADHRAEIKSTVLGVAAAEKGIKLARSSSDPTVVLALAGNYYPTTSFAYPRQSTATLALSVNIPIFDGGQARAAADDAKANLDSAEALEDQVRRAVSLDVQNSLFNVDCARKSLVSADAALHAAMAAKDLAQQRYEGQVGLYLEVTDAQAALSAAQAGRVNAVYDLLIAKARLERAMGDLSVPEEP